MVLKLCSESLSTIVLTFLLPLLGSIVDKCGRLSVKVDVTKYFMLYVDTVNTLYRKGIATGWSEEELDEFEMNLSQLMRQIMESF